MILVTKQQSLPSVKDNETSKIGAVAMARSAVWNLKTLRQVCLEQVGVKSGKSEVETSDSSAWQCKGLARM